MTADERVQGRKTYPLKANIDKALKESCHEVERVFVASRTGKKVTMTPGRDVSLENVCMNCFCVAIKLILPELHDCLPSL